MFYNITGYYYTNSCYDVTVSNHQSWGGTNGNGIIIAHGAFNVNVIGGIFYGSSPSNQAILIGDGSYNITVRGSLAVDGKIHCSRIYEDGLYPYNILIEGCSAVQKTNDAQHLTRIETTGNDIVISNCKVLIYSNSNPFIWVHDKNSVLNCLVKALDTNTSSEAGIKLEGSKSKAIGNSVVGTGRGIWIRESTDCIVNDNYVIDSYHTPMFMSGTGTVPVRCIINGNKFSARSGSSVTGIDANVGDYHIVTSNIIQTDSATKKTVAGANSVDQDNIGI